MNEIKYRVTSSFAYKIERECAFERQEESAFFPGLELLCGGHKQVGGIFSTEKEALDSANRLAREDARNFDRQQVAVSLNGVHL